MLVKIYGSAVFGVEATTIIVEILVTTIFTNQKSTRYQCFVVKKVETLANSREV
jgi:hypothetical protein